jgi:hypothetical protein
MFARELKVARLATCNCGGLSRLEYGSVPHAWETSQMKPNTSYVGLDVHKSTISVAVAEEGRRGEVGHYGVIENRADIVIKLASSSFGQEGR